MKLKFGTILFIIIFIYNETYCQMIEEPIHREVSLHTVIFSNTNDPKIGQGCQKDFENIKRELEFIAVAANLKYEEANKHVFVGDNFSAKNIDSIVSNLRKAGIGTFQRFDVLIVYISTHGFRRNDDSTDFPNIELPNQSKFMNAYRLHELIARKVYFNLRITIIDACNAPLEIPVSEINYFKNSTGENLVNKKKGLIDSTNRIITNSIPIIVNSIDRNNYTQLFREVSGDFIITSSQPGYPSFSNSIEGSHFTNAFIEALHSNIKLEKNSENWNFLLNEVKGITIKKIRKTKVYNPDAYFPVWNQEINLISVKHPTYLRDVHSGKEKFENEKYQLRVNFTNNLLDENVKQLSAYIEPMGEWGRSPQLMISQMDSVEYTIYEKGVNGMYFTKKIMSNDRINKFKISVSCNKESKIMATIYFSYKYKCTLNIMHFNN